MDFPTQISHVGESQSMNPNAVQHDFPDSAKWEAFMRHVRSGHALQDVPRSGAPQSDGTNRGGPVHQRDRVIRRQVIAEPFFVATAIRASRHHPKILISQAHDRQIRFQVCFLVQQGRINQRAWVDVHLIDRHLLNITQGSRSRDIKDGECR